MKREFIDVRELVELEFEREAKMYGVNHLCCDFIQYISELVIFQ
jgi:hypothetical protein